MQVYIPTPLRSYTNRANRVQADGATLGELLADLDRRYPGLRFRVVNEQDQIREHMRFFVNQTRADDLNAPLKPSDQVHIVCSISGG